MKKILILLILIYGHSAMCEGLQVRADLPDQISKIDGRRVTVESYGSGVLVLDGRFVLTAYHVVADSTEFYAKVKGEWKRLRFFHFDKKNDLALLRSDEKLGEPVEVVTIPELTVSGSLKNQPTAEHKAGLHNAIVPADIDEGSSGAPLMVDGRIIGLVKDKITIDGVVCARIVGADVIAKFLKP